MWQNNVYGFLNPGWTFNVLNESESDNFDEAFVFIYDVQFEDQDVAGIQEWVESMKNKVEGIPPNEDLKVPNDMDVTGIQKWAEPMRIKVEGNPSDEDLKALNDIIDAFNSIGGFPGMQIVNSDENVRIIYTTKENFKSIENQILGINADGNRSFCQSSFREGEIIKAIIVIEPDKFSQGYRNTIVLHEISHAIGFYNHVSDRTSIMTAKGPVPGLSKTDTLALKMLYNSDIPIGMPYSDFVDYYDNMTIEDFLNK